MPQPAAFRDTLACGVAYFAATRVVPTHVSRLRGVLYNYSGYPVRSAARQHVVWRVLFVVRQTVTFGTI